MLNSSRQWPMATAALAVLLAGCGAAPDEAALKSQRIAECVPMSVGSLGASVNYPQGACAGCTVLDLDKASDGNLETFAAISVPAAFNGEIAVRAQAPAGLVFPQGLRAAAVADAVKTSSVEFNHSVSLTSLLAGEAQDSASDGNNMGVTVNGVGQANLSQSVLTRQPFDGLEFVYSSIAAEGITLRIFEFCSSSRL